MPLAAPIVLAILGSTKVLNTKGGVPCSSAHWLMRATTDAAFSWVSIKGMRTASNLHWSNCDKTEWLNVSAVIPVLSETTKTVRCISDDVIMAKSTYGAVQFTRVPVTIANAN